jgi:Fe-S cluster biogenesis protein NfuA
MTDNREFQKRAEKIEKLVQRVHELTDENARNTALDLVQEIMDLHGSVMEQILELTLQTGEQGNALMEKFSTDPIVSGLLVLYDLHPETVETRIGRALEKVRPYLHSHGGDVEMIGFRDGELNLRLTGHCDGCAGSTATLKTSVEQAIHEVAPEVATIVADGSVAAQSSAATAFIPLAKLQGAA